MYAMVRVYRVGCRLVGNTYPRYPASGRYITIKVRDFFNFLLDAVYPNKGTLHVAA